MKKQPGVQTGLPKSNFHLHWNLLSSVGSRLLQGATVVAFVSALETIAIGRSLAVKNNQKIPKHEANQEWVALGCMNMFGSFASAYPVAGSFSRSGLNAECEATSPVAVLTVAVFLAIILKWALRLFQYLPKCALSAIVVVALLNLADPEEMKWLWKHDRKDLLLWMSCFLCVLFTGVEVG